MFDKLSPRRPQMSPFMGVNMNVCILLLTSTFLFTCFGSQKTLQDQDTPQKFTNPKMPSPETKHVDNNQPQFSEKPASNVNNLRSQQLKAGGLKTVEKSPKGGPDLVRGPDIDVTLSQPSTTDTESQSQPINSRIHDTQSDVESQPCLPEDSPAQNSKTAVTLEPHFDATTQNHQENEVPVQSLVQEEIKEGKGPVTEQRLTEEDVKEEGVKVDSSKLQFEEEKELKDSAGTETKEPVQHKSTSPPESPLTLTQAGEIHKTKEDEVELPAPKDDIMPFDEWKQKKLEEHSQQLKSKQLEAQSVSDTIINGKTGKMKATGSRHNYASLSCGAKVISSNPEAQSPSSILTENKDQYMIQPCKAKKWFVVELCESVQVRSLEVANLELFSSLPETFVAHVSDRFPTKEWKALGTFHARDQRAVQTFSVSDEELFAKFLKVEMQSHYGTEHYCPLTLLRVYGVVEEEEDDNDLRISAEEEKMAPTEQEAGEEVDNGSNLFKTATDTVMKLVKDVLNPSDGKEKEQAEPMDDVVHLNISRAKNASRINDTAPVLDDSIPCMPEDGPHDSKLTEGEDGANPEPETPLIRHMDPVDEEDEEDSSKVVTLIESPSTSLEKIIATCHFCQHPDLCTFLADRVSTCAYYRTLKFIPETCCIGSDEKKSLLYWQRKNLGYTSKKNKRNKLKDDERKGEKSSSFNGDKVEKVGIISSILPETDDKNLPDQETLVDSTSSSIKFHDAEKDIPHSTHVKSEISPTLVPDTSTSQITVLSSTDANSKILETQASVKTTQLPQQTSSLTRSHSATINTEPANTLGTKTQHVIQSSNTLQPSPTERMSITGTVETLEQPLDTKASQDKAADIVDPNSSDEPKNIYADVPAIEKDLDLETLEVPELDEPVKLTAAGKQTTFMRLKNRIKALELNLNLSSRYLEELSQRYKKQMEEMYASLNYTIIRLTNTSRASEERYHSQQVEQKELKEQIARLTDSLVALQQHVAVISTQAVGWQLGLMIGEAVIFIFIILLCWGRVPVDASQRTRTVSLPAGSGPKVSSANSKPKKSNKNNKLVTRKRRNSIDATPTRPKDKLELTPQRSVDDIGINRRSESEDWLPIVPPTIPTITGPNIDLKNYEVNTKKRKRKKNQVQQLANSSQLLSNRLQGQPTHTKSSSNLQSSADRAFKINSSSRLSPVAGVIFGAKAEINGNRQRASSGSSSSSTGSSRSPSGGKSSIHRRTNSDVKPGRSGKSQARLSLDFSNVEKSGNSRKYSCPSESLVNTKVSVGQCGPVLNINSKQDTSSNNASYSEVNGFQRGKLAKSGSAEGRLIGATFPALENGNSSPTEINNSGNWKNWFPGLK